MKLKKYIWFGVALAVSVLLAVIGDVFIEDDNFRIMSPDTVYRSAQVTGAGWDEIYNEHKFASILNLRGYNADKPWYAPEIAFAAKNRIEHYDLALSANREPDLATMEKLVQMMRDAPKPLLIHCKQGADRTGLASALYEYAINGKSAEEAREQLSILYGHFPWLTSRTGAMDKAFEAYVAAHPRG